MHDDIKTLKTKICTEVLPYRSGIDIDGDAKSFIDGVRFMQSTYSAFSQCIIAPREGTRAKDEGFRHFR
jgi:hypothetical protein